MPARKKNPHAVALGRKGGKRRLETMTAAKRSALARKAARAVDKSPQTGI